jgi:c-di-GMP-binding flagellar brake protein YcgR
MADDDRRQHKRVSASVPVRLGEGAGATSASTRDLSEGGVAVVVSSELRAGDKLPIEVLLDEAIAERAASMRSMATVMWSAATDTGAYVAGLRFDGPSPDALDRLRRFLSSKT